MQNEKLNKLKQNVKENWTMIIPLAIATAGVGTAVVLARKQIKLHGEPYLRMSSRDAKMVLAGNTHVRFDTKFGPLVLKALIDPEN